MKALVYTLLLISSVAQATHLRSGYISIKQVSPGSLTCEIKLTIYTNTGSEIRFGDGQLSFGDGQIFLTPTAENTPRPDLGPNIGTVIYTTTHTYATAGAYLVSYVEANRNADIINMSNSVETRFYMESFIDLHIQRNIELDFVAPIVYKATLGGIFSVGLGVTDEGGYRYQYFLITPKKERNSFVDGYSIPSGVQVNPYNGQFTWPLDQALIPIGEYAFALRVEAYDENEKLAGYVVFDFQVIVVDGDIGGEISDNRVLDLTSRIYTADTYLVKVLFEGDTPDWELTLYADLSSNAVSMSTTDSVANGKYYKIGRMTFNNLPEIRRQNPYVVVVRSSQHGPNTNTRDISYLFFTEDVAFTDLITAVEKSASSEVRVYPNPIDRFLNINGNSEANLVTIYRLNGQQIMSRWVNEGEPLDLIDLPRGHYVARINGASFRLIKN